VLWRLAWDRVRGRLRICRTPYAALPGTGPRVQYFGRIRAYGTAWGPGRA